ncbi:MAG: DUF1573 domain-containing protein [Bacteroidales bacterium]|nr:DUF1573 domain-containing protein [Bacteroidales bacterium]
MKKTVFSFMGILLMATGIVFAQQKQANISFNETNYDFGKFKEEKGKVTHNFDFTNTGNQPLIINNVRSSCGCTTPEWTNTPVAPGAKGSIKVTYNAKNRPNKFHKTITIQSNAITPTVVLKITGDVIPRQKTVEDYYPQKMGDLRLKSNHLAFMNIKNTEVRTDSLNIVNTGAAPITIGFERVPAHLILKAVPATLKPNQKGHIIATYDAAKKNDWGFVIDRVNLTINGQRVTNNRLSVSATIKEDFSKMVEKDKKNAAHVTFDTLTFNFGTINQGDVVSHNFKLKNTGKSDLLIRKIKSSCGCTATAPESKVIGKGKSSSIKATFNSRGKVGKQHKTITVITNDPDHPETILRVTGYVNKTANKPQQGAGKPIQQKK